MTTAQFSTNAKGTTTKVLANQLFTLKADDAGSLFWDNGCGNLHPVTLADQVALEALDLCFPEEETSQTWDDKKDAEFTEFKFSGDDVFKSCDDAHADNDFMF